MPSTRLLTLALLLPVAACQEPSADPHTGEADSASPTGWEDHAMLSDPDQDNVLTGKLAQGEREGWAYSAEGDGTHNATLSADSGTDFDLYLLEHDGTSWQAVAKSDERDSSDEALSYAGGAGEYAVGILAYAGMGSYTAQIDYSN